MNQQATIETFFYMLGQFAFEKAKTYIEAKKDFLYKASPSSSNQPPFVSLLATFAQLAEAEKCYHNQPFALQLSTSFLPPRNLLRRERSIKDIYEEIRVELQKIEARPRQDRLQAELERKLTITVTKHADNEQQNVCNGDSTSIDQVIKTTDPKDIPNKKIAIESSPNVSCLQNANRASTSSFLASQEKAPSENFASPKRPRSSNNSDHVSNHHDQSPNKYFTLSPLSWLYNGFKQKTPTSSSDKRRISQPGTPSSAARRLFCDADDKSDELKSGTIRKSESMYATIVTDGSKKQDDNNRFGIDEATHNSPSKLLAAHSSSRQVLSPIASGKNHANNNYHNRQSTATAPPPPNSLAVTPMTPMIVAVDFSEELMSHFCLQLQYYTQARLELIGIYGKLYNVSSKKHLHVDGISLQLSMFCRKYQKYFHHPLLAPIKEGMTLECEVLVTLIKAIIDIQHSRFLQSVFDLQEALQKLNYWASNTFNKDHSKRRFNIKAQPVPRLYDWMCKLREFLVAKFTIYFHTTLYRNLPRSTIKNTYTKLSIDFYQKLSHFQRKVDALFIALLIDVSNEKDYRGQGYHFARRSGDQPTPKGNSALQVMIMTPAEAKPKLDGLLGELYVIVLRQADNLNGGHYQLFDPSKQLTFFLTKPDPHIILVTAVEGQRPDKEVMVKAFMIDMTHQLSGNRMILSLNNTSTNLPSK